MSPALAIRALTAALLLGATALAVAAEPPARPAAEPVTEHGYLTVRDGAQLQYTLTRPAGTRRVPALLNFAGYDSGSNVASSAPPLIDDMVSEGFAVIGVNVRGSGCSSGTFDVFEQRWAEDGYDVVEWVARQRWSDGAVGMFGGSFPGITQLLVAAARPPHLRAIAPLSILGDVYRDIGFPGGIPNVVFPNAWYGLQNRSAAANVPRAVERGDQRCGQHWAGSTAQNPPHAVPTVFVEHRYDDAWMRTHAPGAGLGRITVPALVFTQWQDEQVGGRVSLALGALKPDRTWVVASNGNHAWGICARCVAMQKQFFRWALKGQGAGWRHVPHFQVWEESTKLLRFPSADPVGDRGWVVTSRTWPPRVEPLAFSLASAGRLLPGREAGTGSSSYAYPGPSASRGNPGADNANAPTGDLWETSTAPTGHGLVFTSAPFDRDRVLFQAAAELWLSSTATDTDLQVTLTEVRPDGQETFIQRGWLRASHRREDPRRTTVLRPFHTHREADVQALQPLVPALARVEVMPFSHPIRRGSALRLIVDAPTGLTGFWGFDYLRVPAVNTVLHDRGHRSRLLVGVLPGVVARGPLPPCGSLQNQPCRVAAP